MPQIAKEEKQYLLKLARRVIEEQVRKGDWRREEVRAKTPAILQKAAGAFVTLRSHGSLRGCIGRIRSEDPLLYLIQKMAIAAATQDPRFSPLEEEELKDIHIEVSVLSPPEVLKNIEEIEVGKHGLIVHAMGRQGILLPQVATEENWDRETFLTHTCLKTGLPPDFWTYGKPKIEFFTATVFEEADSSF